MIPGVGPSQGGRRQTRGRLGLVYAWVLSFRFHLLVVQPPPLTLMVGTSTSTLLRQGHSPPRIVFYCRVLSSNWIFPSSKSNSFPASSWHQQVGALSSWPKGTDQTNLGEVVRCRHRVGIRRQETRRPFLLGVMVRAPPPQFFARTIFRRPLSRNG
jgi:hypothetical protein